jgi:L-asparagine transporter-like permease
VEILTLKEIERVSIVKGSNVENTNIGNKSKKALSAYGLAGIGIGGMIGSGFFLGSGIAIKQAGPSVILAFLFGGIIMSQVLGAMTSISINRPVIGSFRVYTEQFLGKFIGYSLGWIIYVSGILGIASEAIAAGVFLKYWMPRYL